MNSSLVYRSVHPPLVDIRPVVETTFLKSFEFEKFDIIWWRNWVFERPYLSLYISSVYLSLIFIGQRLMRDRKAFGLNRELILWNFLLASFSIFGLVRSAPEFWYNLRYRGIYGSACLRPEIHSYTTAYWGLAFLLSKIVELGDTAFLVLRKKKILFLHFYHHASVLCFCWNNYASYNPAISYYSFINYVVHSFMYSYFTLTASGVKINRKISMVITCLQLSQMVVGLYVCFYSLAVKAMGSPCENDDTKIYSALGMYASYLILFADFFRRAYLAKGKSKSV